MFKWIMLGKFNNVEIDLDKKFSNINYKQGCSSLCKVIQGIFNPKTPKQSFRNMFRGKTKYANTVGHRK